MVLVLFKMVCVCVRKMVFKGTVNHGMYCVNVCPFPMRKVTFLERALTERLIHARDLLASRPRRDVDVCFQLHQLFHAFLVAD